MLDYGEFRDYVQSHIHEYLPEEFQYDVVSVESVLKNNGTELYALIVRDMDASITPAVYLEEPYKTYLEGSSMGSILTGLSRSVVKSRATSREMEQGPLDLTSFDYAKDRIIVGLVNIQSNEAMLQNVPHNRVEDLAVIYKILVDIPEGHSQGTVTISHDLMAKWDITLPRLDAIAKENSQRLLPATCSSLFDTLIDLMNLQDLPEEEKKAIIPDEVQMYVISNVESVNGASVIVYTDVLQQLSDHLGENLYILPSSTHEVLAIPESLGNPEELSAMVQSINQSEVKQEEQLSDHVYHYDAQARTLKLADTTVEELGIAVEHNEEYTPMKNTVREEGESEGGQSAQRRCHR